MNDGSSVEGWFGLAGVLLGFLLGEGWGTLRRRRERSRMKGIVASELSSVIAQLPQKRDVLRQGIEAFRAHAVLPLASVHMVSTGYYSVLPTLYPHLTAIERNCLHVIYERLRVAEEFMDGAEAALLEALPAGVRSDPFEDFATAAEEQLESLEVVERLARSYLAGHPTDVFRVGSGAS